MGTGRCFQVRMNEMAKSVWSECILLFSFPGWGCSIVLKSILAISSVSSVKSHEHSLRKRALNNELKFVAAQISRESLGMSWDITQKLWRREGQIGWHRWQWGHGETASRLDQLSSAAHWQMLEDSLTGWQKWSCASGIKVPGGTWVQRDTDRVPNYQPKERVSRCPERIKT